MITANSANGKEILIAERNVYRYTAFINQQGEKGLLLVAMSVSLKIPTISLKPGKTA